MIPIILFVYKRTDTLEKTLDSLRRNRISKLIVYADAPKAEEDRAGVEAVRKMVSAIDWCDVELNFRERNAGLGANIMDGVTKAFERYEAAIVCEDDLQFVEGTIDYMNAALEHYAADERVMSVTGYTNARLTPEGVSDLPYFDGRAECWLWGTWRRVWRGMTVESAEEMMKKVIARGEDPYRWGGDLPYMAKNERKQNIWAVRFCYLHILNRAYCLRPPWSMVNHIGWGAGATNVGARDWQYNGELKPAPAVPVKWPEPVLAPQCAALARKMFPRPWVDVFPNLVPVVRKVLTKIGVL